jgi:two-component system, NarL family, sensor histidine kinase UhpB
VFLIFKEALTNAARHASARRIEVEIALGARELLLEIRDDGRGFDPRAPRGGRGLSNLARRAAELRATLEIDSAPGRGTRIALRVPLRGRASPHNDAVGSRAEVP